MKIIIMTMMIRRPPWSTQLSLARLSSPSSFSVLAFSSPPSPSHSHMRFSSSFVKLSLLWFELSCHLVCIIIVILILNNMIIMITFLNMIRGCQTDLHCPTLCWTTPHTTPGAWPPARFFSSSKSFEFGIIGVYPQIVIIIAIIIASSTVLLHCHRWTFLKFSW